MLSPIVELTTRVPRLRAPRRVVAVLVSTALLGLGPVAFAPAASAQDSPSVVERVNGSNRIDTAVAVARTGWARAPRVLLATSKDYPDAIAAAGFASSIDAPLLLTDPAGISAGLRQALQDFRTERVTILGGPRAVSDTVKQQLLDMGVVVDRVAGTSRWETAAYLSDEVARRGPVEVVAIALGDRADGRDAWPDALAAASLAALDEPIPTLLTRQAVLPEATIVALQRMEPGRVILLGGEGAVHANVEQELRDMGFPVERLNGANRYETAVEVAMAAIDGPDSDHGELDPRQAVFVSGEGFADALAAGALAAHLDAPLLLVPGGGLADEVDAFVRADATNLTDAIVVGGPKVILDFVTEELAAAINGDPRPEPPPTCDPAYSSPDCQYTYRHPVSTWESLADCESHGQWDINTGNGYYGGLQFSHGTWQSVGGQGYAHQNSKWEQIHRGDILQERSGWGQWPHCSRKLGLR